MIRFYGNTITPSMPLNLRIDVKRLQELDGFTDVNSYGKVAPCGYSVPVHIEQAATTDYAEHLP